MKKLFCILLVLCFVLYLCGCDREKTTENNSISSAETSSIITHTEEKYDVNSLVNQYMKENDYTYVFQDYLMVNMKFLLLSDSSIQKIEVIDGNIIQTEVMPFSAISDIKTSGLPFIKMEVCSKGYNIITINLSSEDCATVKNIIEKAKCD